MIAPKMFMGLMALVLALPAQGQGDFQRAHTAFTSYWFKTLQARPNDVTGRERVHDSGLRLHEQVVNRLTPAILDYLNSPRRFSLSDLKERLSRVLTAPTMGNVTAKGVADAVSVNNGKTVFVAYTVDYCIVCSKAWLGKFVFQDGKFDLQWSTDSVAAGHAVHLVLVGNGSSTAIALYGVQWGDPHNHLGLWMFSSEASEPEPIWSLYRPEGDVSFAGNKIVVSSDTEPTQFGGPPDFRQREIFQLSDNHVELIRRSISKTPVHSLPANN